MSNEIWSVIHELAERFGNEYPTKNRMRVLLRQLEKQTHIERQSHLQDVEYLCLSLEDLRSLAQEGVTGER